MYFNRTDVKKALHVPVNVDWRLCTEGVFGRKKDNQNLDDTSLGPALNGILAKVIDVTKNVLIGNGDLDFLLPTNGTLLALQNVTWGGIQGFSKPPTLHLYVPYHPEYNQGALADAG